MTAAPLRGEIWWTETEHKRRPVVVVTRSEAAAVIDRVVVAPVTRTVRGIPSEAALGPDHGLREECVATFDDLLSISRSLFISRVGRLDDAELCRALSALADC